MATIIDFIEELRQKQQPMRQLQDYTSGKLRPVPEEEEQRGNGTPPRLNLTIPTPGAMSVATEVMPPNGDTPENRLMAQRAYTRALSDPSDPNYAAPENNDRGFWGRLLDVGRQAVISAGQAYNTGQGSPSERLMGALGAGIAGGAYGGFHPQVDEERQRLYDIQRSQGLEGQLEGQIDRDQQRALKQEQIDAIPVNQEIRKLQVQSVAANTALREFGKQKYFDPNSAYHRALASRAGLDVSSLVAFDARDPKTVKIGNDVLMFDRTAQWTDADGTVKYGKFKIAGTRGDLVDYKLSDGRVVSIPADKAAYNDTLERTGAMRIESTEKIARDNLEFRREDARRRMGEFDRRMKMAEEAVQRGDTEFALKQLDTLSDDFQSAASDLELDRPSRDELFRLLESRANAIRRSIEQR